MSSRKMKFRFGDGREVNLIVDGDVTPTMMAAILELAVPPKPQRRPLTIDVGILCCALSGCLAFGFLGLGAFILLVAGIFFLADGRW